jgi:hypothetical protein
MRWKLIDEPQIEQEDEHALYDVAASDVVRIIEKLGIK